MEILQIQADKQHSHVGDGTTNREINYSSDRSTDKFISNYFYNQIIVLVTQKFSFKLLGCDLKLFCDRTS